MEITTKDLYQLLVAELRYGFTRNNHLMPDGAFRHCKGYIPKMFEVDKDAALATAKQAVEETICEFRMLFDEGLSYEKERYEEYKDFIMWGLHFMADNGPIPYIYNIDSLICALEKHNEDISWIKENFTIR